MADLEKIEQTSPVINTRELGSENGSISFADDVVAIIAGLAASEIEGVAGMSGGVVNGIAELLGRKNLSKGVKVEVGAEEAAIDVSIVVAYGFKIPEVVLQIQENIKKAVETMTGLKVIEVNVNIQGIHFESEPVEKIETTKVRVK